VTGGPLFNVLGLFNRSSEQEMFAGSNIGGATSSSYTTPATTTADSGATFVVVVSNSAGTATSNAATLTVNAAPVAPSITTQPANQTVTAGQTATFSVVAGGTAPLSVFVPVAVHEELTDARTPEIVRRRVASLSSWFEVRTVDETRMPTFPVTLHRGERQAILLAEELRADVLLIDEQIGRSISSGA